MPPLGTLLKLRLLLRKTNKNTVSQLTYYYKYNEHFRPIALKALNAIARGESQKGKNVLTDIQKRHGLYNKYKYSDANLRKIASQYKNFNKTVNNTSRAIEALQKKRVNEARSKLPNLANKVKNLKWSSIFSSNVQAKLNTQRNALLKKISTSNGSNYTSLHSTYKAFVHKYVPAGWNGSH